MDPAPEFGAIDKPRDALEQVRGEEGGESNEVLSRERLPRPRDRVRRATPRAGTCQLQDHRQRR
jgi:hypothetical protein